jgi:hypothetical protein
MTIDLLKQYEARAAGYDAPHPVTVDIITLLCGRYSYESCAAATGQPLWLVMLADKIAGGLPTAEAIDFGRDLLAAPIASAATAIAVAARRIARLRAAGLAAQRTGAMAEVWSDRCKPVAAWGDSEGSPSREWIMRDRHRAAAQAYAWTEATAFRWDAEPSDVPATVAALAPAMSAAHAVDAFCWDTEPSDAWRAERDALLDALSPT